MMKLFILFFRRFFWRLSILSFATILSGCAHNYFYMPETAGDGAMHSHGGVIFSIPPTQPKFKMKLTSLGVKDGLLGIRMYIIRTSNSTTHIPNIHEEFLDPKEQILILSASGQRLLPVKTHASTAKKPLVALTAAKKQAIEFFFRLPSGMDKEGDIQSFSLAWKIHFSESGYAAQISRFDRSDSRPEQGSEMFPADSDYPYDESPVLPAGWFLDDWGYWE
jgi:hypothetical protein